MALRMYNVGPANPGEGSKEIGHQIIRKNGAQHVAIPSFFAGGRSDALHPHEDGNVYFSLVGHGFFAVPRGGHFDVPEGVTAEVIKAHAPTMMTLDEYQVAKAAGGEVDEIKAAPAEAPARLEPVRAPSEKPKKN